MAVKCTACSPGTCRFIQQFQHEADFVLEYWSCQPSVVDLDETCP
jgi:hypothetical protein